ncbi:hypothetical protein JCM14076_24380 [Methylosoma difficile]
MRFVFVTIATAVITKVTHMAIEKWVKTADLGLNDPSVIEVSDNVARQVRDYDCKGLLLKGNQHNQIGIQGNGRFASNLTLLIEDLNSNKVELSPTFYASGSSDSIYKKHIGELPFPGVKRFIGKPHNPNIDNFRSPNIVVANDHEVRMYGTSRNT